MTLAGLSSTLLLAIPPLRVLARFRSSAAHHHRGHIGSNQHPCRTRRFLVLSNSRMADAMHSFLRCLGNCILECCEANAFYSVMGLPRTTTPVNRPSTEEPYISPSVPFYCHAKGPADKRPLEVQCPYCDTTWTIDPDLDRDYAVAIPFCNICDEPLDIVARASLFELLE